MRCCNLLVLYAKLVGYGGMWKILYCNSTLVATARVPSGTETSHSVGDLVPAIVESNAAYQVELMQKFVSKER